MTNKFAFSRTILLASIISLTACGGGGSSDEDMATSDSAIISGKAAKGIIIGGSIVVAELNSDGTVKTANVGSAVTDADGKYSITLTDNYMGGPLEITVTSDANTSMVCDATSGCGTTTDSAFDTNGNNLSDFGEQYNPTSLSMSALIPEAGDGDEINVQITPFTHMAAQRAKSMDAGLDTDTINQANTAVSNLLGLNILTTEPVDITVASNLTSGNQAAVSYAALSASIIELAPTDITDPNNQPDIGAAIAALSADFEDGSIAAADDSETDISLGDIVSGATAILTASDPEIDAGGFSVLANIESSVDTAMANGGTGEITPNDGTQGAYTQIYASRSATVAECANGGQVIEAWFDRNDNGLLDSTESATDYIVCNGAIGPQGPAGSGGSAIMVVEASVEQCPAGGKVVSIDDTSFELCNGGDGTNGTSNEPDYVAASAMMDGFATYIAGLEVLETSLNTYSAGLEAQSDVFDAVYDESLSNVSEVTGLIINSILHIYDANKNAATDQQYTLDEALAISGNQLNGTSDLSFLYTASTNQVSVFSGSEVNINDISELDTIDNIVSFGAIELPNSATGSSFIINFEDVTATNPKASLSIPVLKAELTTTNSIDILLEDNQLPGQSTLSLDFGSEETTMTLENITTIADDEFSFEGFVHAEVIYMPTSNGFHTEGGTVTGAAFSPKEVLFNGILTRMDVSTEVNLAINVTNADTFSPVYMVPELLAASDINGQVEDFLEITLVDFTSEYDFDSFSSGSTLISATTVTFSHSLNDDSEGYWGHYPNERILSVDSDLDGVADQFIVTPYYYSLDSAESYEFVSDSIDTAFQEAIEDELWNNYYDAGFGAWYLYGNDDFGLEAYVQIDIATISTALQDVGIAAVALNVVDADAEIDVFDGRNTSFDNFPKVTASVGLELTGLKDTVDGSDLAPIDITITADMSHYLDLLHTIKIDMVIDGDSFSAKMNSSGLEEDGFIPNMTFQDNQGGRIEFRNLRERFTGDYWREDSHTIGYVYYDNIYHGDIVIDYYGHGNIYVVWADDTEVLIYSNGG
jgi:hypothetical protein